MSRSRLQVARISGYAELLQVSQLSHNSGNRLQHFHHVRQIAVLHPVVDRVIVGVEAVVGELFADEHGLVAMVEEAGVVGTVLHGIVVRVHRREVDAVALDGTEESHSQLVRAVLVDVIVDVQAVARLGAVADHVDFDHGHHIGFGRSDLVGIGVATPEALLLAGEVNQANSERQIEIFQRPSKLEHTGSSRTIVVSTRRHLLVAPGRTGGGIEVSADENNPRRIGLAGQLDHQVVELLAAHSVGVTNSLEAHGRILRFDEAHGDVQLFRVGVARGQSRSDAIHSHRQFARELEHGVFDAGDVDDLEGIDDASIRRRQIAGVDLGRSKVARAAHFRRIELAAARPVLAVVNGVEVGIVSSETAFGRGVVVLLVVRVVVNRSRNRLKNGDIRASIAFGSVGGRSFQSCLLDGRQGAGGARLVALAKGADDEENYRCSEQQRDDVMHSNLLDLWP